MACLPLWSPGLCHVHSSAHRGLEIESQGGYVSVRAKWWSRSLCFWLCVLLPQRAEQDVSSYTLWQCETDGPEFGSPVDPMQIAWPSVTACAYIADDGRDHQSFCVSLSVLDRMSAASSRKAGPRSFPCLWIGDLGWSVLCSLCTISLVGIISISVIN